MTDPASTSIPSFTLDRDQAASGESVQRSARPRLLFCRLSRRNLAKFVYSHLDEQVKCLSFRFNVTLIEDDCDYDEMCDKHQPDIALFESGVYAGPRKRKITNTSSHPNIPKVGFFNGDS